MTVPERQTFAWAAATYPLPTQADSGNALLLDADPVVYYALDFWRTCLQTHLGDRWAEAAAAASLTGADGNTVAAKLVQQVAPFDPAPYLRRDQLKFPLLACYRRRTRTSERTIAWLQNADELAAQLIFPPLSAMQAELLMPFLKAARDVIVERTWNQSDATYASGASVWTSLAKVELVEIGGADYRAMLGTDDLVFPTVTLEATFAERTFVPDGAYDDLAGVDATIQPVAGSPAVDPLVDMEIDL